MDGYLAECKKFWGEGSDMIDYCRKKAVAIVQLTSGAYFVIDKPCIQTHFCFGYSTDYTGHEQSDAEVARRAFKSSQQAFKNANLSDIDRIIEKLEEYRADRCVFKKPMIGANYHARNGYVPAIHSIQWTDYYVNPEERLIKEGYTLILDADLDAIISAYKEVREGFVKRIDRYLKRYGTSKLHTWTYWRDE